MLVMGGSEYLLILQNTCDLIRTFAACTQFEDIFYNGSSFFIGNNLLAVCGTLLIAIRCLAAVALTTLGLHPLDVQTLMRVFHHLVDNGATVIVIEHDLDVIRQADYIVDMGPGGGVQGGRIVACGAPLELASNPGSITGRYL